MKTNHWFEFNSDPSLIDQAARYEVTLFIPASKPKKIMVFIEIGAHLHEALEHAKAHHWDVASVYVA